MNKLIINCKETGEERTFENSHTISENLETIKNMVYTLNGCINPYHNPIQISIPTDESFHELTYFIETLHLPSSVLKDWIFITSNKGTQQICVLKKAQKLFKRWDRITEHAKLYGAKITGNTFDFKDYPAASAFIEMFARDFLL